MKYIYIYTTPLYQIKNWYKIGETIVKPEERVRSQDNASNPEKLILIDSWKVPKRITDKKVHRELEQLGFNRIRREWFELSNTPKEDVFSALSKLTGEVELTLENTQTFLSSIPILNYTKMWWFQNK
jgi:hypothetical protein